MCVCVVLVGSGGSCKWCALPGGAGLCDRRRVSVKDKFHLAARQPGRYLQRGNTNLPSFRALCAPENACRWGRWRRPASDVDGWFSIDLLDGSIGRKRKYKCNQQMTSARRVRNLSCRFQSLATGLLMFGTVPCPCVCGMAEWNDRSLLQPDSVRLVSLSRVCHVWLALIESSLLLLSISVWQAPFTFRQPLMNSSNACADGMLSSVSARYRTKNGWTVTTIV